MTDQTRPVSQTLSFTTVFLIEMWERFGFYGMQVLMVTFMMKKLGFIDTQANLVWGAAAALIYATPAIGGWVGDKLLGTRRTMLMGAVILAIGYAMLWMPTNNAYITYLSLGVIVVGNGFFKPNAGNLVRKIYEGDETRIDSAFTIYYMAVNVGSMISMTATPWIRNYIGARYGDDIGWHTFRHTYRSWLDATGAPMGVQQKLMRHAQISTTMNVYGNALMEAKREANAAVVSKVLRNA
jgi:POT family proton-dependent oligopeptide transporter